jgi:hypothetical protein
MASPELAGLAGWALLAFSLVGCVVLLSSPDIVPDRQARKRIGVASAVVIVGALLIAQPLGAFYYDLDPYCRYAWWWDFITCGW